MTQNVSSICSGVSRMKDKSRFKNYSYIRKVPGNPVIVQKQQPLEEVDKTPIQNPLPPGRVFSSEKKARIRLLFKSPEAETESESDLDQSSNDENDEKDDSTISNESSIEEIESDDSASDKQADYETADEVD